MCVVDDKPDFRGTVPESWQCIDCGRNTAPGIKNRAQTEQAFQILKLMGQEDEGVSMELNEQSEVYHLCDAVWKAAGMAPFGGCLCIGCLEKRLGRQLRPPDFDTSMPSIVCQEHRAWWSGGQNRSSPRVGSQR